jgi:hypothetical protein
VLILSARSGLLEASQPFAWYDRRLAAAARELRPGVRAAGRRVLGSGRWRAVAVCAGKESRAALDGLAGLLPQGARVERLGGWLGKRPAALRDWLRR